VGDVVEGGAVTWNDPFLDALEPVLAKFRDSKARRESLFILKCIRIAGDLETCEALMRGEKVPKSRLDPYWRKAYGIR
jgi:hypothetical protein